jgi:DDE_Tnp_1-associated
MTETVDFLADEALPRARLALLLKHFSRLDDEREPWRVMYPLSEVLLLLTCATIASCDDFDEIAAWGKHHLDVLREFALIAIDGKTARRTQDKGKGLKALHT